MKRALAVLLMASALGLAGPAAARQKAGPAAPAAGQSQSGAAGTGGGLDFADQKSGTPLEVYADQGLELSQDAKTVIGRGNAKAIRGRVTVTGDVLIAHYRDKQPQPGQPAPPPKAKDAPKDAPKDTQAGSGTEMGGNSEIWRVEADGHVTIATQTQTAYGDHADYNIDDAVVVLTGKDLHMVTPTDLITARDSLEYWEHRQQAVARGDAVAVRADKRIQADILVADFAENSEHHMAVQRAHGYDHVILTTPREVVTGDRADYNVETGIVTVTGSVKMTRDNNQLNGGYAVVNLDTGISRLYPAAPGDAGRQVKGLFVPQKKQGSSAPDGAATAASPAADEPAKAR